MPTKKQLHQLWESEFEFPETRREDDPMYVSPNDAKLNVSRSALWLVAEGEFAVLKIEVKPGEWVELIRERLDAPFSHIVEPSGISSAIEKHFG